MSFSSAKSDSNPAFEVILGSFVMGGGFFNFDSFGVNFFGDSCFGLKILEPCFLGEECFESFSFSAIVGVG